MVLVGEDVNLFCSIAIPRFCSGTVGLRLRDNIYSRAATLGGRQSGIFVTA